MGSMNETACRICGAADHNCAGGVPTTSRQIIDSSGVRRVVGPLRVPRQRNTIGRAGYIGNVETFEPRAPKVRLVEHPADELQARAEAFIQKLPELFRQTTPKDWDDLVAGALSELQEEDKTIAERASRLFRLAYDYNGDWSRREDTIQALEKLDRDRVLAILTEMLDPAKRQQRTFLGFAKQHTPAAAPKTSFTDPYTWKKTRKYQ